MTPDERDRLARLEANFTHLKADVDEIKSDMKKVKDVVISAKGGWKVLVAIGAISGSVGAAIGKFAPFLTQLPR